MSAPTTPTAAELASMPRSRQLAELVLQMRRVENVSGTPPDGSITNAKLATMPPSTMKGNNGGGTADLTVAEIIALLGLTSALTFIGSTDCSTNPNYPAATKAGNVYRVSVAGKIGGASGTVVSVGDMFYSLAANAGGTQASVGTSWQVEKPATALARAETAIVNNESTQADLDIFEEATETALLATVTLTTTQTITNKRITARVTTITSSATPTVNTDNCDAVTITALAAAITSMTTNLSGTPVNFDQLVYRIKDDGTARTITWGASFAARGASLPTTTVAGKVLTVVFQWNSVTSRWDCLSTIQEA